MNKRLLELEPTSLFGKEAVLVSFSGRETISKPFEFTHDYAPHPAIDRMLTGTAPQLGVIAGEVGAVRRRCR